MDKKIAYNPYQTTDPRKLLELKRLEADTLLDLIRSVYSPDLSTNQVCMLVRNALKVQLNIKKQAFYYELEGVWTEGILHGFVSLKKEIPEILPRIQAPSFVDKERFRTLSEAGVEYIVPAKVRGVTKAVFFMANFADSEEELQNDIIFIETVGHILYSALHNRQLIREKFRQEVLRKELELAESIQKQFLVSDFSKYTDFDVYAKNIAFHGIGGDYYDIIQRGKNSTYVCIADVSGKGIGAALLMANLQANLRALCVQYDYLPLIITELNKMLYEMTKGEKFVTLFIAKIDTRTQQMIYVNAGHNYPIFITNNGVLQLESQCVFLGAFKDINPPEGKSIQFSKRDLLCMFTDGLTEQTNPEGEAFGEIRLIEILKSEDHLNAKSLTDTLILRFTEFARGAESVDDLTLLTIKF